MEFKLKLYESLIIEAVKGETYIKGRYDKASDAKLSAVSYEEEAGDERFHERKLHRTLRTSLAKLLTLLSEHTGHAAVSERDSTNGDIIYIIVTCSERIGKMGDTLAKLCSKYLEDHVLFLWWGTIDVKQAEFYRALWLMTWDDIKKCFVKGQPEAPSSPYPSWIKTQVGRQISVSVGERFTVTYQKDYETEDDVEAMPFNPMVVQVGRKRGQSFTLIARSKGESVVKLYSRHNEDVCCIINVVVH